MIKFLLILTAPHRQFIGMKTLFHSFILRKNKDSKIFSNSNQRELYISQKVKSILKKYTIKEMRWKFEIKKLRSDTMIYQTYAFLLIRTNLSDYKP